MLSFQNEYQSNQCLGFRMNEQIPANIKVKILPPNVISLRVFSNVVLWGFHWAVNWMCIRTFPTKRPSS